MGQIALLICEELTEPARNVTKILDLFGIPWKRLEPRALVECAVESIPRPYCVICPIPLAGRVLAKSSATALSPLLNQAESAFLYGADHTEATGELLKHLTRTAALKLVEILKGDILCKVSDRHSKECGPMSGLYVPVTLRAPQFAIATSPGADAIAPLISTGDACVFGVVDLDSARCYLAPCSTVIDIDDPVGKGYFDVTEHFLAAVPLVMYLKHSFAGVAPAAVERGACLIIDDPVLRPRYGFVNFKKLAAASVERNFACNIAFIPWNWRRSAPSVVGLFKKHQDRLSLSVHGCDHSSLEFAGSNAMVIARQARLANSRMDRHRKRTGLAHDALMVFPQGAFSPVSLPVLKHNGFIAAINTEVSPTGSPSSTQIRDTWGMAILKYGDFPIYTRRYPFHGLHNFAFDVLLGKPCLLVTHHTDFSNDSSELLEFIDRLNALKLELKWRSLGGVIRRAYQHWLAGGNRHVRMFGNEIIVENSGSDPQHVIVEKSERVAGSVARVELAGRQVKFGSNDNSLRFEFDLRPGESALARVCFTEMCGEPVGKKGLRGQVKVAARRYASEVRDELHARAPLIYKQAEKARRWIKAST
jgi:hypothetical protein